MLGVCILFGATVEFFLAVMTLSVVTFHKQERARTPLSTMWHGRVLLGLYLVCSVISGNTPIAMFCLFSFGIWIIVTQIVEREKEKILSAWR
jgi:hypothetical protein